ncbi:MAG: hypothetical protein SCALA702_07060 [Melioribacteraceae bacterium]|nr:MAG: hypothetical protein SCALA702_07060 [Melioribacteraceae bacterium]
MKKTFTVLFILILNALIPAQDDFSFEFDYAQFGFDSTSNYIEFYYSFNQQQLKRIEKENQTTVTAKLFIDLKEISVDTPYVSREWSVNNIVEDGVNSSKSLVGVLGLVVPRGDYKAIVKGYDPNQTAMVKEFSEDLTVIPRLRDDFSLSDIQLASNIKNDNVNENSIFYKNTLEVLPNPITVFTNNNPVVFYYTELYGLNMGSDAPLILQRDLFNSRGILVDQKTKSVSRKNASIVEVGVLNMQKFPTDSYNMVMTLFDSTENEGLSSTKRFYMINPDVKDTTNTEVYIANYLGSEFGVSSEEELDDMFAKCKYIAASSEIDQYEKLDSLNSKREYFYEFWKKRDPDPSTNENEFKIEYMYRLDYVNERYGSFYKKGYRTDRGRIYLLYGEPDQIDRYPNETNMKPYEIWYFNTIEGGVYFVFGDITGFSDYELLSSTKRGEIRDDNWTRRVQTN